MTAKTKPDDCPYVKSRYVCPHIAAHVTNRVYKDKTKIMKQLEILTVERDSLSNRVANLLSENSIILKDNEEKNTTIINLKNEVAFYKNKLQICENACKDCPEKKDKEKD